VSDVTCVKVKSCGITVHTSSIVCEQLKLFQKVTLESKTCAQCQIQDK